jgi:alkylation response protein AidB-like acyl-CoA dehydrogenase
MKSPWFNDEHEMLRDTVRKFVTTELAPHAEEWEKQKDFPNWVFKRAGELGLLGITFPEKYGGSGLDFFFKAACIEELPKANSGGVALALMTTGDFAANPINILGNEDQKQEYLVPILRGEKIAAIGITEPNAGSDAAALRTTAKKDGDYYILNGSKTFITNGSRADVIVTGAKTDPSKGNKGISLFLVDTKDQPGFSVGRKIEKMGMRTSDTAELVFEDVRIHKSKMLGEENKGFVEIMVNFQGERLIGSIWNMAGAALALERTIEYVKQREAFGQPLSKFQVLRHRIVEMECEVESCRQFVYYCCWLYNNDKNPAKHVSMAKAISGELAERVTSRCLQLYGGYGYCTEYDIERMYRDFRLSSIGGGTTEIMREIVSRMMQL